MAAPSLDDLAAKWRDQKVAAVFVYTHEAHPGEHFPHHTSLEQKLAQAREFQRRFKVQRPILVDSLDGLCHRAYGSMPNMCWIMDRAGRPVYKADWTDSASVERAVRDLFARADRRRDTRLPSAAFKVELLESRPQDQRAFLKGLEVAGPKAVAEFKAWALR